MTKIIKTINSLNNSKYFAGIAMLLLNIGSKYISIELSDSQEEFLQKWKFLSYQIQKKLSLDSLGSQKRIHQHFWTEKKSYPIRS